MSSCRRSISNYTSAEQVRTRDTDLLIGRIRARRVQERYYAAVLLHATRAQLQLTARCYVISVRFFFFYRVQTRQKNSHKFLINDRYSGVLILYNEGDKYNASKIFQTGFYFFESCNFLIKKD